MEARYPAGWDAVRVRGVLAHYEAQSPEEALAEDEAAYAGPYEAPTHTAVDVLVELVPAVRDLIARARGG